MMNHWALVKNDTLKASHFHDPINFLVLLRKIPRHSLCNVGWFLIRVAWMSWGSAEPSVETVV